MGGEGEKEGGRDQGGVWLGVRVMLEDWDQVGGVGALGILSGCISCPSFFVGTRFLSCILHHILAVH